MQWKKISLFIALPGIGLCAYNAVTDELEHMAHHEQPEFTKYDHLRIRKSVSVSIYYSIRLLVRRNFTTPPSAQVLALWLCG